jgi:phosphoglycolate phosphatase-like HAD superfamily hydrolase
MDVRREKIAMIQEVRRVTGLGLAAAKKIADGLHEAASDDSDIRAVLNTVFNEIISRAPGRMAREEEIREATAEFRSDLARMSRENARLTRLVGALRDAGIKILVEMEA